MQDAGNEGAEGAAIFGRDEERLEGWVVAETIRDVYVCSADVFVIIIGDLEREESRKVEGLAEVAEHVAFVVSYSSENTSLKDKAALRKWLEGTALNTVPVDIIIIDIIS